MNADEYLNHVIFPAKVQTSKPIDVPYIHVYVWSKDDKHVIWMWIWLILKNISLLDIIWSLWLIRFAHSPTNFIFWIDRLIFSVSTNSHPDNIYLFHLQNHQMRKMITVIIITVSMTASIHGDHIPTIINHVKYVCCLELIKGN